MTDGIANRIIAHSWDYSPGLLCHIRMQYTNAQVATKLKAKGRQPIICGLVRTYRLIDECTFRGAVYDLKENYFIYSSIFNNEENAREWVDDRLRQQGILLIEETNIFAMI